MNKVLSILLLFAVVQLSVHHDCDHEDHGDVEESLTTEEDAADEEDGSGSEEDDDESEEDKDEAFNDIEDEDLICANYVSAPRKKMLPHAVVIGVRKGGTR